MYFDFIKNLIAKKDTFLLEQESFIQILNLSFLVIQSSAKTISHITIIVGCKSKISFDNVF